jgi:hypothetical protein
MIIVDNSTTFVQSLLGAFGIVIRRNASPIQRMNLMDHPLLALKRLRGMFKDLDFIASSQSRS